MRSEPTLRFLPLSDGKTPLFMWAMMPLFKIFHDPLFAGRILSVMSGLGTLLGVIALSWKLFNLRIGLISGLIYAVVPYAVFFDRMALVDSMLAAFTIWSLFFAVWLVQKPRLDLSMILGYLFGGALLVKTPALLNILVLPFSVLAISVISLKKSLGKIFIFWVIAILIAEVIYNLLRLGPGFQQLSARNADYIFSPLDLVGRPLDPFIPHLGDIADWFPKLLTAPVLLVWVVGLIWIAKEKIRVGWMVLAWALVPFFIQVALLKTFTARYLFFSIPPLLILAGYGMDKIIEVSKVLKLSKGILTVVLLIILVLPSLLFDRLLLTKPEGAPLPREERIGYLEDWTAGYGLKDVANFLIDKKNIGPVVVGTEGNFGTLPEGLMIYLDKADISVIGGKATISGKLRDAARTNQTFFVGNRNRIGSYLQDAELIKTFPKAFPLDGRPQDAIVLYKVLPK